MNEYTRRDEVRWTLIASLAMILFMAPAVVLLVSAKGKLIPDPAARASADQAAEKLTTTHACVTAALRLENEIGALRASAKAAHVTADDSDQKPHPKWTPTGLYHPPKPAEPDAVLAWNAAQPAQKAAKQLAPCRTLTEALAGVRADATPAWNAVVKAATTTPATTDAEAELTASRTLLLLLNDIPVDQIIAGTRQAEAIQKAKADNLEVVAKTARIRETLPDGIVPRRMALGLGVALSVLSLLLSYLSVRSASNHRLSTLVPLRDAAKANKPGLHAAAILRLSAMPSGGLPGPVIGGALGALLGASLLPADADVFIGGVMVGFLCGLLVQLAARMAIGAAPFRSRATELSDLEKPSIPVVLVLGGIKPGLEGQFIDFLDSLPEEEAGKTVEKLAAQAEERILAAADAGAAAR